MAAAAARRSQSAGSPLCRGCAPTRRPERGHGMRVRPAPQHKQGWWRERALRPQLAAVVRAHDSQVCAWPGEECEHPGGHDAEEQEAGTDPVALVDRLRRGDRDGARSAEPGGRQQRMAPDCWQDGSACPARTAAVLAGARVLSHRAARTATSSRSLQPVRRLGLCSIRAARSAQLAKSR